MPTTAIDLGDLPQGGIFTDVTTGRIGLVPVHDTVAKQWEMTPVIWINEQDWTRSTLSYESHFTQVTPLSK